jgi:Mg-chelatase subunit ChlD
VAAAGLLSFGGHTAAIGIAWLWPVEKPQPEPIIELTVLDLGDADEEVAPHLPPSPAPAPPSPKPVKIAATRAATAPSEAVAAVQPAAEPVEVAEIATEADRPAPSTFRDWQASRRAPFLTLSAADVVSGSGPGGARKGVDRCDPPKGRRSELVYLLFDSSGSMTTTSGPNALTCAHQYAKGALEAGAEVLVVNFARESTFFEPTRSLFDVEVALRSGPDPTATNLPSQELQPFVDRRADAVADLVIVSDGIFDDSQIRTWYGWFMELNPDNRGRMFTVGGAGARESVTALRSLGFDVYMYEPLAPPPTLPVR